MGVAINSAAKGDIVRVQMIDSRGWFGPSWWTGGEPMTRTVEPDNHGVGPDEDDWS